MAIEQYFIRKSFQEGPLASQMEGFCQWMNSCGFSRYTTRKHISRVYCFNQYLKQIGVADYTELNSNNIDLFINEYISKRKDRRKKTSSHDGVSCSIHRFIDYLQEKELIEVSKTQPFTHHFFVDEYLEWMKTSRNLVPKTLKLRCYHLIHFLDWLGNDSVPYKLSKLSPEEIQNYFVKHFSIPKQSGSMRVTLRTFFHFCYEKGYISSNLDRAVPTLRTYKLASIPHGLSDEQAKQILNNIDRNTDVGRRNYAIIQLLYVYGVRGGQIRTLCLDDIQWAKSRIHFKPSKGGKDILLPITDDVGESLIEYIRNSRPQTLYSEVFLTCNAPYRPLYGSAAISKMIACYVRANNISVPKNGSHAFRYCFATRMLRQGHSLKSIADMMGHRHIQTTFIYTKVDFNTLNKVALDWPEEGL